MHMLKYDKLVNLLAKEKYKKIIKNKKFYKIILLTYNSQVIEYSKIAKDMQRGIRSSFFHFKEVVIMYYHPINFYIFIIIG